jgi:GH15 family glucan-1,4-alpha-glucosidase
MTRIEDYALIGDCRTAALVSRDGSIDWLCWPRFSSPACFAALLGDADHGRWRIAPVDRDVRTTRRYRADTMILETTHETGSGAVTVIDFMPPDDGRSDLVRMVVGERGAVDMRTELVLRFGYGAFVPWISSPDTHSRLAIAGPDMVGIWSSVPLPEADLATSVPFTIRAGETVSFVLTWQPSHERPLPPVQPAEALSSTEHFWREWSSRCTYEGEFREAVLRSLLTLKALTFRPTGGMVAAPTTSLPEEIGSSRNWDYRVCWLRDATLTLIALMDAGYYGEALAWRDWLLRAAAGSPAQVQIMYGLSGERRLTEWEVTWLPGYEGSRPVRVGNAASEQLQLDVFGEVFDALHQARTGDMPESRDAWNLECALASHLEQVWVKPDQGMWEVRGGPQHFTHSKVMAWVAIDRAIRSAEWCRLDGPVDRWRALRERMHQEICERAFDSRLGSFVQAYGSSQVDASCLLLPLVGFLPANDPRVLGTVRAIESRLRVDGFVYRYDSALTEDGLPPGEGAFLACSFWLADNYLLQDRHDDARRLFDQLLAVRNDVGLLSEEYHPGLRRQVGNFPQAFSHVALVTSALNLGRAERRATPRRNDDAASAGYAKAAVDPASAARTRH